MLLRNRKGGVLDLVYIVVGAMALGLSLFVGMLVMNNLDDAGFFNNTAVSQNVSISAKQALGFFDYGFLIIVIGMGIAAIIGAFLIPAHPVFLPFSILLLVLVFFVNITFGNVFLEIAGTSTFSSIANTSFPTIIIVFQNLPYILVTLGAVIIIVMYGKTRGEGY